jgi:hypothetical protein
MGSGTYWKDVTFGPYTGGRPSNVTTSFSSFDIDLRFLVIFLNSDVVHVILVVATLGGIITNFGTHSTLIQALTSANFGLPNC